MQNIEYDGHIIPYTLYKSKIKNMYIYIKEGKVLVKVPSRVNEKRVQDFLNKKSEWIYKNLEKSKEKIRKEKEERIEQKDIERLQKIVEENIYKYSKILGKSPKKVRIRDLKYAWGSCSSNKNISINLKLALKDERAIESGRGFIKEIISTQLKRVLIFY